MSIDFTGITGVSDDYGVVTQIADAQGNVLWSAVPPETTIILRPTGDRGAGGSHEDCAKYPADAEYYYSLVNEEVADDAATYIIGDAGFDYGSYGNGEQHEFEVELYLGDESAFKGSVVSGEICLRVTATASETEIYNTALTIFNEDGTQTHVFDIKSDQWFRVPSSGYESICIPLADTSLAVLNSYIAENRKFPKLSINIGGWSSVSSDAQKSTTTKVHITQVYLSLTCLGR